LLRWGLIPFLTILCLTCSVPRRLGAVQRGLKCLDCSVRSRTFVLRERRNLAIIQPRSKKALHRHEIPDQLPRFRIGNISSPITIIDAEEILDTLSPTAAAEVLFNYAKVGFTTFQIPAFSVAEESDSTKLESLRLLLKKWRDKKMDLLKQLSFVPMFDPSSIPEFDELSKRDIETRYFSGPLRELGMSSFPLVQVTIS